MIFLAVLNLTAELCLYWTLVGLLLSAESAPLLILCSILGAAGAMGLGCLCRLRRLRPVCLLPALLPFLLCPPGLPVLLLLPPVLYTGWLLLRPQPDSLPADSERRFLPFAGAGLALLLFSMLIGVSHRIFPVYLGYLAAGVLFLRLLRLQEAGALTPVRALQALAVVAGLFFAGVLLSLPALWQAVLGLLGRIYTALLGPILMAVLYAVLYSLAWAFNLLASLFHFTPMELPSQEFNPGQQPFLPPEVDPQPAGPLLSMIFTALGVLLFLALALLLFRQMAGRGHRASSHGGTDVRTALTPAPESSRGAGGVRKSYRRVLRWLAEQGESLPPDTTTADVTRLAAARADREDCLALQKLYREVRYGDTAEDTAHRKQARELARRITRSGH